MSWIEIQGVDITPNPVVCDQSFLISVAAVEWPQYHYILGSWILGDDSFATEKETS